MYDTAKIVAGLAIFVVIAASPFWLNALAGPESDPPELVMPTNGSTACVEDIETMRESHMIMLDEWRDDVVRNGNRYYTSKTTGETFEMSLTNTCLGCHTSRDDFCNRCHNYAAVTPYCFDCHVEPGDVSLASVVPEPAAHEEVDFETGDGHETSEEVG